MAPAYTVAEYLTDLRAIRSTGSATETSAFVIFVRRVFAILPLGAALDASDRAILPTATGLPSSH